MRRYENLNNCVIRYDIKNVMALIVSNVSIDGRKTRM